MQVIGATLGQGIFPTGNRIDETEINGKCVPFTVCDVGNIAVFARAADLGISGHESPAELDKNETVLANVKQLRGKVAYKVGMCRDWERVDEESPMIPMIALVSPATDDTAHLQSRLFLDNRCHSSMAGTVGICTAACSRARWTLVHNMLDLVDIKSKIVNIQHPSGILPISVEQHPTTGIENEPSFKTLSFVRTARYIFQGSLFIPDDLNIN